jgi:hypothetical protein
VPCAPSCDELTTHTLLCSFLLMVNKQGQTRLAQYYEARHVSVSCSQRSVSKGEERGQWLASF